MDKNVVIYLAGDSTVSNKEEKAYPEAGWGMKIDKYFLNNITISNHAMNGRSSKSFIEEERLAKIAENIKKDDFLFIQFGHNDEKTDDRGTTPDSTYKMYLKEYILVARHVGAHPILVTPVNRRTFDADGTVTNSHAGYYEAMLELGKEENVPVLDLLMKSKALFESIGEEECKKLFMWLKPCEYENYPEGKVDNTHFKHEGAEKIARLVAEEIVSKKIETLSELVLL